MDPYAAQTYPHNQPPNQDPYLYNQSQQYPYYPQIPQPQYPNPNPNPNQEHAPIHPPGVPIQNDPNHIAAYQHGYGQTHFPNDPNSYYPQQPQQQQQQQPLGYSDPGMVAQGQQQQWQQQGQTGEHGLSSLYPPSGQGGQFNGSGRSGGRGFRGGGSSFRGRGRGRGRGGKTSVIGQPKPQCMAWCELCRVDCNTLEILENHKNGKKHKKNLKIQEDLQKLAAKAQETQMAAAAAEKPENSSVIDGSKVENQVAVTEEQGNGLKRKMSGERKSTEPLKKPKEIVPFICELCNVKCESAPTFDSHLKGKKHGFNLQRFQEQQATLGQVALQALYPALEVLYPALLQAISQNANASTSTVNGGLDQQVLQWLQPYLPQTGPLGGLPQGPELAPGPGFEAQGPNVGVAQEGPTEAIEKQVDKEPESKTEGQVEPESKIEGQVEPKSKTEEKLEPESKTEQVDSSAAEPNQ